MSNNYTLIHQSIRIETYKTGEGNHRYSFDSRTPDKEQKARDFANSRFKDGCKVSLKHLFGYLFTTQEEAEDYKNLAEIDNFWDSVNITPSKNDHGYIAWCSTVAKVADGRPPKAPKSVTKSETPKKPKKSKTSSRTKSSAPSVSPETARLDALEKQVADLTLAVNTLVESLKK